MGNFKENMLFGLMRAMSCLPLRVHHLNSALIAFLLERVVAYRKEVIEANLSLALPSLTDGERRKIARQYYRNISDLIAEFVWSLGRGGDELERKGFVTVRNPELLAGMYDDNRGAMLLHSHSGNWEMLPAVADILERGARFSKDDMRTTYKRLSSPFWEAVTIRARTYGKCRQSQYIESKQILRYMLKHRGEGLVYHFLVDQYPYQTPHPIGNFLGVPTNAIMGAANLAERFCMPVLYVSNIRVGRGRYELSFTKICDNASEMGAEGLMKRYFELLEQDVVKYPSNWLWSHKRWKNIKGLYPRKKKPKSKKR